MQDFEVETGNKIELEGIRCIAKTSQGRKNRIIAIQMLLSHGFSSPIFTRDESILVQNEFFTTKVTYFMEYGHIPRGHHVIGI